MAEQVGLTDAQVDWYVGTVEMAELLAKELNMSVSQAMRIWLKVGRVCQQAAARGGRAADLSAMTTPPEKM